MKSPTFLLLHVLLCRAEDSTSFVTHRPSQRSNIRQKKSIVSSPPRHPVASTSPLLVPNGGGTSTILPQQNAALTTTTATATATATTLDDNEHDDKLLPASIAVGAITAAMGFLYGKVLGLSVHTVWKTLPSLLLNKMGINNFNPVYFITGMCTLGGLLMGILSSKLGSTFAVSDFVSAFSSAPAGTLPSSRIHLLPLLLLSLVTSSFGFSVGPEAPMVCAGGLVGASLARYWYGKEGNDKRHEETLAYAGAAGALTAFMGIPIAGSIFALELTRSTAGLNSAGERALSPAVMASLAALVLIRAFFVPSTAVGGHFSYSTATLGALSGRAMMTTAVTFGVGGAVLGTLFHKFVTLLKMIAWPAPPSTANGNSNGNGNSNTSKSSKSSKSPAAWKRQVLVKTTIGLLVGILSSYYPQTLFWGEGSLQCMIDGQATAFSATKHGLGEFLTSAARVNPSLPFSVAGVGGAGGAWAASQVGLAKFLAIALACAGKFPGGIIFPLFFAAAPLAHAVLMSISSSTGVIGAGVLPVAVMCLMASTQSSVTRTPLATALILSLTASATTELSVMLPACLISSYLGVFVSRRLSKHSYFQYNNNSNK